MRPHLCEPCLPAAAAADDADGGRGGAEEHGRVRQDGLAGEQLPGGVVLEAYRSHYFISGYFSGNFCGSALF